MRISTNVGILLWILLGGAFLADFAQTEGLTPQQKRGKAIYLRGVNSEGREISAFLGDPPMEVPGSLMACGNCHGYDGRGKPESGVVPSDLTPEALTKSYGVTHAGGRKHPPYTDSLLEQAIRKGLDPAGNRLHTAMPRYQIPAEDISDLVAYLKRLGKDSEPGITDDALILGTLVPSTGPLAESGRVTETVLRDYFEDLNQEGGIYARKIVFRTGQLTGAGGEAVEQVGRILKDQPVFALVGASIAGSEEGIIPIIEDLEIPLVGPTTLYPFVGSPLNRHIFYLFSGLSEQLRALAAFAVENFQVEKPRIGIVYADGVHSRSAIGAITEECRQKGWPPPLAARSYLPGGLDAEQVAHVLSGAGAEIVFFLGPGADAVALAAEAERLRWSPRFLCSGSLTGREILQAPAGFAGKFYLSFPMLLPDQMNLGVTRFRAFAAKHNLGASHMVAQFSAYCAAWILVEGLKLAGRELSREKLITALEGMYRFDTGLMPPVSFGPNRRIGAMGAHVVEVDPVRKNMFPIGGWVEVR